MGSRGAEQGQQAVPGHVLHRPSEGFNRRGHQRNGLTHHRPEVLWVESLGERRRADDVREQGGDGAARFLGRSHWRPAL